MSTLMSGNKSELSATDAFSTLLKDPMLAERVKNKAESKRAQA
jgi:hypothetical protein